MKAPPPARSGRDIPPSAPLPLPLNSWRSWQGETGLFLQVILRYLWYPAIVKLPRLLILPLALLFAFTFPDLSLAQKKPAQKARTVKVATKAAAKKSSTKPAAARSKATRRGTVARRKPAPRRPATQQQPTEDRVRDIQQALTDKGYPVEVSGVWGPQSVEALKKFQEDQNINNMSGRGKLDSLTLIALGLGPKREPPPTTPEPAQPKATTEGQIP